MTTPQDPFWVKLLPSFLRERIQQRHQLHRSINSIAWLGLDKAVRIVVGILISASVARYLGPSLFGQLAYVIAFLTFFLPLTELASGSIITRYLVVSTQQASQILCSAALVRFGIGALGMVFALSSLIISYGADSQLLLLGFLACGMFFGPALDVVDLWCQSRLENGYCVRVKLANYLFFSFTKLGLIWTQSPITAFACIYSIETVTTGLSLIALYRRLKAPTIHWTINKAVIAKIVEDSWPLMIGAFMISLASRLDFVYIEHLIGHDSIAFYATAQTVAGLGVILPSILFTVLVPTLSHLREHDEPRFFRVLQVLYQLAVSWGLCSGIFLYYFADVIINFIYGSSYDQAAEVLQILSWGIIFGALGLVQGQWLFIKNGNRLVLKQAIFACVVISILDLILIPLMGLRGAALAFVITQLTSYFLSNLFFQREIFKRQLRAFAIWELLRYVLPRRANR